MIVVDFNQTAISSMMAELGGRRDVEVNLPLIRHMIINAIRSYKKKFGAEFGDGQPRPPGEFGVVAGQGAVEDAVLEERPRHALDHGPDDLALRGQGVDGNPAVVHGHDLQHADVAGGK